MPAFQGIAAPNAAVPSVHSRVLALPFGIHSSLTAGIPSARVVTVNSEARNTNGETITDNISVGFGTTPGSNGALGIVIDGCSDGYSDLTFLPGINRDLNVTVCLLGTALLEVEPGQTIAQGSTVFYNPANGKGVGSGFAGAAGVPAWTVLRGAAGTGTAANPEYAVVLVR
jgi:hypothetical protein